MIVELGHFAVIFASCLLLLQILMPFYGVMTNKLAWQATAVPLAIAHGLLITISFICLSWAFVTDDFSVKIVALQSNTLLPSYFKFTALWGGHEGSLLLWLMMLSWWMTAVAIFSKNLPMDIRARVLSVLALVAVGFCSFMLFTSNPFDTSLPDIPQQGADLNPLLQDFAMIIHPPMLYCGYVGFSVAFAFAIAALSSGRLDAAWAKWSRPWTTLAWGFLTIGITLGSWWAYYELGWGGWWFWDPVENASFMPWLAGTALIHSLAVTEKRNMFKSWTVLLAIVAFSLCLLGTFLVRSGILTSVHSFAADPERGFYILVLLAITIGGSLTLYAFRAPAITRRKDIGLSSRESLLLVNNILLVVATASVLLGTLFPLLMDALDQGKYSVGPPYFNKVFVPVMSALIIVMAFGPFSNWKKTRPQKFKPLLFALLLSVSFTAVLVIVLDMKDLISLVLGLGLFFWLLFSHLIDVFKKAGNASSFAKGLRQLSISYWAMFFAHIGLACTVIGIGVSVAGDQQREMRLVLGQTVELSGYQFTLENNSVVPGPNWEAQQADISVRTSSGKQVDLLTPQKRRYFASGQVMTEAGINGNLFRDIYVSLGEKLGEDAWAVRINVKPMVRWIWLGGILMLLASFMAAADKRYRRNTAAQAAVVSGQNPKGGQ